MKGKTLKSYFFIKYIKLKRKDDVATGKIGIVTKLEPKNKKCMQIEQFKAWSIELSNSGESKIDLQPFKQKVMVFHLYRYQDQEEVDPDYKKNWWVDKERVIFPFILVVLSFI